MKHMSFITFLFLLLFSFAGVEAVLAESATVQQVVDGGSLKVIINGKEERLQLIGIELPEGRTFDKSSRELTPAERESEKRATMKQEAAKYLKSLVQKGDPIGVEFDAEQKDKRGNLLGYIYLSDGRLLNEEIIRVGYVNNVNTPPNIKYQNRFLSASKQARDGKKGLFAK